MLNGASLMATFTSLATYLLLTGSALAELRSDADETLWEDLKAQIDAGDMLLAEAELSALLETQPQNADVLNLLGYANRKLERYEPARDYYERALAIAPNHLGALEYMGELELETGDLHAAQRLRSRLELLCPTGCEELEDLNAAFAEQGY